MTPTPGKKTVASRSPLTNGTWVLVADGKKALLLENTGDAERPVLEVRRADRQDNPATRAQGTDRPGRFAGPGGGQHGTAAPTDWHQLAEDRFAHELAALLYRQAHAGGIDRLVLVAAPRLLGELRKALHAEVTARVVAELALDLTGQPVDEIARRIAAAAATRG
ncbi:host attachment protein [Roseibacterium sp. KMU-115]|uniref:Host attachment protein n=2 Tax=Roseicyclus persicicus TaxID=2650661 RepID=A0A7X6H1G1_9RHOB|nr:host attachment protein [Roseibacterium persicicum]